MVTYAYIRFAYPRFVYPAKNTAQAYLKYKSGCRIR